MDAQPDPIGVKKKQKQTFDSRFFKFDAGIASFIGGKAAPYKSGYYADLSFVGQAFKKKGAFEWMMGYAYHKTQKLWAARSVGVPVDSLKSVSNGFEMYTGLVFFWNVVNKKKIAVLAGLELPVSFHFLPEVDSKVAGTQTYIDMAFDFTPGVKVTALIGTHLVANAEYLISTSGTHEFENYLSNVKTKIPMDLSVMRVGLGYRF